MTAVLSECVGPVRVLIMDGDMVIVSVRNVGASPLGREVRVFIPAAPVEPSAQPRFPPSSPRSHPTLVCVYLAISALLAWFVGATICQVILRVNYDRMGMAPGLYIGYQIIVGYLWLICLLVCGCILRFACNRIWAAS